MRDRQVHSPAPGKMSVLQVSMWPLRVGSVETQRRQIGRRQGLTCQVSQGRLELVLLSLTLSDCILLSNWLPFFSLSVPPGQ